VNVVLTKANVNRVMCTKLDKEVGPEDRNNCFNSLYCLLFQLLIRKSMLAALVSYINSLKSGLLHLTHQTKSLKGRIAKVKDGIILETKLLGTISVDRYR
jgi:hypothetical protein